MSIRFVRFTEANQIESAPGLGIDTVDGTLYVNEEGALEEVSVGGGGLEHQAVVSLTNAQIKSLGITATAISVVPLPGANKIIQITSVRLLLTIVDPYDAPSLDGFVVYLKLSNLTTGIFQEELSNAFGGAAGLKGITLPPLMYAIAIADGGDGTAQGVTTFADADVNSALTIAGTSTAETALTGGNAANSMKVVVTYHILNVTTGVYE